MLCFPVICSAQSNWKTYHNSKFEINYPSTWIIREQTSDSDGYYYSFKDNSQKMGGLGVYFLKKKSLFGSKDAEMTESRYQEIVRSITTSQGIFVGEVSSNGFAGRSYTATQNVGGKPAEWKMNLYPYDEYVCVVFGFYRSDDKTQANLVDQAITSLNFLNTQIVTPTVSLTTSPTRSLAKTPIPTTTRAAIEPSLPLIAFFIGAAVTIISWRRGE